MGWRETLDKAGSQIYERMGQEWDAARETMGNAFDLRLRSAETFQKEVGQHDMTQPASPAPDPEKYFEPER